MNNEVVKVGSGGRSTPRAKKGDRSEREALTGLQGAGLVLAWVLCGISLA